MGRNTQHKKRAEAMTGPFKWDLVHASKGHGFSISVSRTLETHEIITAHKLWSKPNTLENAAFLANGGQGVGATWAETAPEQGMLDDAWKTAAQEKAATLDRIAPDMRMRPAQERKRRPHPGMSEKPVKNSNP